MKTDNLQKNNWQPGIAAGATDEQGRTFECSAAFALNLYRGHVQIGFTKNLCGKLRKAELRIMKAQKKGKFGMGV
ncbi:hypothetical protein [Adhaeribacter soli]|uniref:Uncharacterized protein n=1 Tax=Adhaeribacter soli TaxID=2607655 RepID=A0A5N1IXB2_9BACT|nr:hypothetical protein [Adhaeribacter soli]KAA9338891.1 hypothetical protein F0P94_08850 [Adhaeribacter soli]